MDKNDYVVVGLADSLLLLYILKITVTVIFCFNHAIGLVSVTDWCVALEQATDLKLPWRLLRPKLADLDPASGLVKYQTTLQEEAPVDSEVSWDREKESRTSRSAYHHCLSTFLYILSS